jgi:hypothetical protein
MTPRTDLTAFLLTALAGALCALVLVGCGQQAAGSNASSRPTSPSPIASAVIQSPGDSSAQKIFVDPSEGYWNPEVVQAKADTPIDITFGKGTYECSNGVTFAAFGVDTAVDLAHGSVTLHSDGLPAGTYPWRCSMQGMCGGDLIVQ